MESQRLRQLNDFHFIAVCQRWGYWQDEGVCRISSTLVILMSFSGPFNLVSSGFSAAPSLIVAIQLLSHVQLFFRPHELQASLSFTISRILLTPVHWVDDAIQPSHPLSSPSPPAFNLSQHQSLFQWVGSWHQVAKLLEFQHQFFSMNIRVDFL